MAEHKNASDLIGREFGRLVVVSRAGSIDGNATWVCRCESLRSKITTTHNLLSGTVRSCGCLRREHGKRQGHHVMSTHPRWRGKILPLPHYVDDPVAASDHSPCRVPWERYDIVFRPDRKLLKGPPGRPRLHAAEVARRAAAKKPPGRPKYTGTHGERVRNECERLIRDAVLRWEREAGISALREGQLPEVQGCPAVLEPPPPPAPSPTPEWNWPRYKSEQPEAWTRLPWRERKAAIWERARAA